MCTDAWLHSTAEWSKLPACRGWMRLVLLGSIHPQIARIAMGYNADQQMETQELKAESNACASLFLGRLPLVSLVDTCKYQIEPVLTVVIRFDYYPFAFLQSSRKRFLQFRCRSSSWSCKRNIHGEKLEKVPCWALTSQARLATICDAHFFLNKQLNFEQHERILSSILVQSSHTKDRSFAPRIKLAQEWPQLQRIR